MFFRDSSPTEWCMSALIMHQGLSQLALCILSEVAISPDLVWLQEKIHINCNNTWRQTNLHADILRELQNEMAE